MDSLSKEYPYPPDPTSHGLPEENWEYDPDEEVGHFGPFEIGR